MHHERSNRFEVGKSPRWVLLVAGGLVSVLVSSCQASSPTADQANNGDHPQTLVVADDEPTPESGNDDQHNGDTEEETAQVEEKVDSESPDSPEQSDEHAGDGNAETDENPPTDPSWEKVDGNVLAALAADGEAHVIVSLDADVDPERVAESQEQLLDQLDSSQFTLRIAYENIPAIAGVVLSESALDVLNSHPAVISVGEDLELSGTD